MHLKFRPWHLSGVIAALITGLVVANAAAGSVSAQQLVSEPGFHVADIVEDAYPDTNLIPELIGAGLGVTEENPDELYIYGVTNSQTYTRPWFSVRLDKDGDGSADLGAIADTGLIQGSIKEIPLLRYTRSGQIQTGRTVRVVRYSGGYGMWIRGWRSLGLSSVSYMVGLHVQYDETDFAPNRFGRPIPIGAMVPGGPSGDVAPAKVTKLRITPSRKSAKATWNRSARATKYQVRVRKSGSHRTWQSTTKVRTLVSGLKPGKRYTVKVRATNQVGQSSSANKHFRTKR